MVAYTLSATLLIANDNMFTSQPRAF